MAAVEEVEILISKLLSDKAKLREEGIKELSSYLDATGGVSLCPLLDRQTALFSQPDKLRSSTWPGIVRAVCQCNKIECSTSKKRAPKPIFSRVLRSVIQKAEDRIRVGTCLFFPQDIKSLFSHLLEAIVEAPSFVADYSHIIRQLVIISDFCAQISKPVYAKLVVFFLERVKVLVLENIHDTVSTKEEAFRAASTLYCLLQNAPEDFLEKLREPLIEGLSDVFLHLRDEGRVARKLLASLNIFLLKDGINLGDLLIDVHSSIKGFILRTWKVTRDRELKDELVFYGRLQLKFKTVVFSEGDFIIQMQSLVEKDLDQGCAISFTAGSYRFDGGREGKLGTVTKGMWQFLDFAASVLMEAHRIADSKSLAPSKKQRKDNVFTTLTEHLKKGNSLWWGSFCLLVRYHHQNISRLILSEWLKCLSGHLEKTFTDASSSTASFEALAWILRCLQEMAAVSPFVSSAKAEEKLLPHFDMQCKSFWECIWLTVLHWLPLFSSTSLIVDESLKLLGYLLAQGLLSVYSVPQDFWVLKPFSETPSGNVLFFIASFFSSAAEQVTVREDFELWKKLLSCTVLSVDKQEHLQLKTAAILALTVGRVPHSLQPFLRQKSASPTIDDLQDWAKLEDCCKSEDANFRALDELEPFLVYDELRELPWEPAIVENNLVSLPIKHTFVKELADTLVKKAFLLTEGNKQGTLEQLFTFASILISCFNGMVHALQGRGQELQEWSYDGQVYQCLLRILNSCICRVEESIRGLYNLSIKENLTSLQQISDLFLPDTIKSLKALLSLETCMAVSEESDQLGHFMTFSSLLENLLLKIVRFMESTNEFINTNMEAQSDSIQLSSSLFNTADISQEAKDTSILDADFDDVKESRISDLGGSGEAINRIGSEASLNLKQQCVFSCVSTIAAFTQQLPERTCDIFLDLLRAEEDPKIEREILLCLCKSITYNRSNQVPYLVDYIEAQKVSMQCLEASPHYVLTAIDILLTTLLSSTRSYMDCSVADLEVIRTKWSLPQKMFIQIAKLLDDVSQDTFVFWRFRERMAEAISKLLVLDPTATDALLDKFMSYLHDVDYRVRFIMSKKVKVLLQAYTGHEGLFKDICTAFGTKMVMASKEKTISASEVSLTSKNRCIAETAVMTLGEVAACSDKVEIEAVFMICANAAILPPLRSLSCAILNRLARQLLYPNRWKYLSQLLFCIFSLWVKIGLPLPTLVEIRDILVCNSEPVAFLKYCCPMVLPSLLLYSRGNELTWLAKVMSKPVATLVKEFSADIFSSLLPLYCHGDEQEKELARSVLQGKMLTLANLSEDDRDVLIRKNMVSIVNGLFQMASVAESPQFPFHTKRAIVSSVKTVVDGFCGSEPLTSHRENRNEAGVKDVLKIFRADRVFMFILQVHLQIEACYSSRHRRDKLAGLECIIEVIQENMKVPITCRYLFHIILQSLEIDELHEKCCNILQTILNKLSSLPREECSEVLGPQLQLIVWYLVSACIKLRRGHDEGYVVNSPVFTLLKQVTVHTDPALCQYIKELPPFPDFPMFESMQNFRSKLCATSNKAYDLSKFVMQTTELPALQRLKSLQNLQKAFSSGNDDGCFQRENDSQAALILLRSVRHCFDSSSNDIVDVAGDIIAKMGIGDPHAVAFSLPCRDSTAEFSLAFSWGVSECASTELSSGVSDDLLRAILLQLKNYLIDEHALVIELTAQTLKGLLSTEKGCRVLKHMEPKDSKYLSVFSRGFNQRIVEDSLNIMKTESIKKSIPLENDFIWDIPGKTYDDWVCLLVYSLSHYCEDTILRLCQGVIHCKSILAEFLLPHILESLAASSGVDSNICKLISCQVEKHIFSEQNHNTRSIQLFLNALNELRRCDILSRMKLGQEYAKKQQMAKVYWLNLDYLQTASVAQRCGAYFTSALYIEHWCEEKFGKLSLGEPDFSDEEELPLHMELLLTMCTRINEPDGVYGVVRSHKLLPQVLLYEHEGDWSRAVGSYDLLLRNRDVKRPRMEVSLDKRIVKGQTTGHIVSLENSETEWNYNKGLIKSLQRTGCDHVLKMYCKGLALKQESLHHDVGFQDLQYESAWRAGNWNFYYALPKTQNGFNPMLDCSKNVNFHSNLFWCLRSLHEGDASQFWCRMKFAKQELVNLISHTSLESTGNVFPTIIRLQILDLLSKAWILRWQEDCVKRGKLLGPFIPSTEQLEVMDKEWWQKLSHMQYQFDLFEPYVAFHTILLKVLDCESRVPQKLLEFAKFARKAGRVNQAAAAIYELKEHCKGNKNLSEDIENAVLSAARKVQEAKILWAQGQQEMAVNLLKYVINHHNVKDDLGNVYCLTGKWLAETRSDSARIILKHYLQRAVQLLENAENKSLSKFVEKRSRAHYRMAHYSDSLFKSYEERLNSSEWQAALRLRTHKSKEAEVLARRIKLQAEQRESAKKGSGAARFQDGRLDLTRKYLELQKQLAMDNEEAQRLENDKEAFMLIALNSYRHCLTTSDKYDLRVVFRITSLWFDLSTNQGVVKSMLDTINQVKSYKFLPLVYQIASRLGPLTEAQGVPTFQYALTCLVKKLATEHPYHTINQLLALANGDRLKDKQRSKTAFVVDVDKKQAAEVLLNALALDKKDLIQQMKQMVEIYIRLAEIEVKKEDMGKRLPLPRDIRSIRQLELVPVITAEIPVAPNAEYSEGNFPFYKGLSDRFLVMHGINAPKVVECYGSDGNQYRQLAKSGDDDLRQDAVMEQLFSLVNLLLQHHPDTRKRKLGIRTYKVVPFTPSAGVLEWVNGTLPLGEYLMGSDRKGGAHARYGLGDWTFPACREHLEKEEDKHKAFQKVCENFRPVFHNFFLEKFAHPAEWFEKRLAYTRSVAASSMVGYVVGLGDRHSMNILLDQESAEVVHIDLGVAFEQGKMLKMPERVPFRLTRDVVDGMGVTGVEGVFRRCCEETLSVMRTNKDALLTIIEVFLHDPLYKWALSPLKALQRQQDTIEFDEFKEEVTDLESSRENKDAARALMRVKQKLDGYEGGDMRSIQGQVQQLIQDAQDSEKLCQMFSGWAAWL